MWYWSHHAKRTTLGIYSTFGFLQVGTGSQSVIKVRRPGSRIWRLLVQGELLLESELQLTDKVLLRPCFYPCMDGELRWHFTISTNIGKVLCNYSKLMARPIPPPCCLTAVGIPFPLKLSQIAKSFSIHFKSHSQLRRIHSIPRGCLQL